MTESENQQTILIKGGHIVNDDYAYDADVLIKDGRISQIGVDLSSPDVRVIDAQGLLIMPGGIDPRTRFEFPHRDTCSVDDFYHGTRSALAGGTTMIIDCVVPGKDETLVEALSRRRELADAKVCCDYGLCISLSTWNDKVSEEMEILTSDKGINSFALSLVNADQLALNDGDLYRCFVRCRQLGALLQVHAENGNMITEKTKDVVSEGITGPEGHLLSRPEECECEAVNRTAAIASEVRAPVYLMKLTSRSAADIIAKLRKRGAVVFGECTASALGTNGFHVFNTCWRHAAGHLTSPPLRADLQAAGHLMDLLANGDLQLTSSDNCTFNVEQKALGKDDFRRIPEGVNGVEDRMSVVWEKGVMSGKLDYCRFVSVTSTTAAKIFNLYPNKGRIAEGSDADIVLWNPNVTRTISSKTHHQNCDFNIFEGLSCHGTPAYVISQGQVVLDPAGLHVTRGCGRFIPTSCHSPLVYGKIRKMEKRERMESVVRQPYDGPVFEKPSAVPDGLMSTNPITPDRTFYLSKEDGDSSEGPLVDGSRGRRGYTRVNLPPGGKTTQLW